MPTAKTEVGRSPEQLRLGLLGQARRRKRTKEEDNNITPTSPTAEDMMTAMKDAKRELLYDSVSEPQLKRCKADRKDEFDDGLDAFSVASSDVEDDVDNDDQENENVTTKTKEENVSQLQGTKIPKTHPQPQPELHSVPSKQQTTKDTLFRAPRRPRGNNLTTLWCKSCGKSSLEEKWFVVLTVQNLKGELEEEIQGDLCFRCGMTGKCYPKKQVEELLHEYEQGGTLQIEFNSIRNNLTDLITQLFKKESVTAGCTVFGESYIEVAAIPVPSFTSKWQPPHTLKIAVHKIPTPPYGEKTEVVLVKLDSSIPNDVFSSSGKWQPRAS